MTSLTAIFGSSADKADGGERESEKLLHLYWNRAELKKEFSRMRSEQFKLKDRIKEHEGTAARLQQKREEEGGDMEVRIRGDRAVPFGQVAPILSSCTDAGVWNVNFSVYRSQDVPRNTR